MGSTIQLATALRRRLNPTEYLPVRRLRIGWVDLFWRLEIAVETWERLKRQFASKSAFCFGCAQVASDNKKYFGLKRLRLAG
jgi:hypothetical protein